MHGDIKQNVIRRRSHQQN